MKKATSPVPPMNRIAARIVRVMTEFCHDSGVGRTRL
jgi:hypothetical protein